MIDQIISKYNKSYDDVLAIIGCIVGIIVILPFAIYRFYIADYALCIAELIGIAVTCVLVYQSWQDEKIQYLSELLVACYTITLFAAFHLKGGEVYFWIFPIILATYFLLPSITAVQMNIMSALGSIPILAPKLSNEILFSFYPTMILLGFFGYIFSYRSERQNAELRKLATEDALTHVENRRSLNDKVQAIIESNSRVDQQRSMLIFDLDHFKVINDTYGHPVGDQILVSIAETVKANVRITDHVYRYGGEEFVIIANNTSLLNAGKLADFIRTVVEKDPFLSKFKVTISLGVAELADFDDEESWLHRADVALYEAKSGGRNTVFLAEPSDDNQFNFERFSHYSSEAMQKNQRAMSNYLDNTSPGQA